METTGRCWGVEWVYLHREMEGEVGREVADGVAHLRNAMHFCRSLDHNIPKLMIIFPNTFLRY